MDHLHRLQGAPRATETKSGPGVAHGIPQNRLQADSQAPEAGPILKGLAQERARAALLDVLRQSTPMADVLNRLAAEYAEPTSTLELVRQWPDFRGIQMASTGLSEADFAYASRINPAVVDALPEGIDWAGHPELLRAAFAGDSKNVAQRVRQLSARAVALTVESAAGRSILLPPEAIYLLTKKAPRAYFQQPDSGPEACLSTLATGGSNEHVDAYLRGLSDSGRKGALLEAWIALPRALRHALTFLPLQVDFAGKGEAWHRPSLVCETVVSFLSDHDLRRIRLQGLDEDVLVVLLVAVLGRKGMTPKLAKQIVPRELDIPGLVERFCAPGTWNWAQTLLLNCEKLGLVEPGTCETWPWPGLFMSARRVADEREMRNRLDGAFQNPHVDVSWVMLAIRNPLEARDVDVCERAGQMEPAAVTKTLRELVESHSNILLGWGASVLKTFLLRDNLSARQKADVLAAVFLGASAVDGGPDLVWTFLGDAVRAIDRPSYSIRGADRRIRDTTMKELAGVLLLALEQLPGSMRQEAALYLLFFPGGFQASLARQAGGTKPHADSPAAVKVVESKAPPSSGPASSSGASSSTERPLEALRALLVDGSWVDRKGRMCLVTVDGPAVTIHRGIRRDDAQFELRGFPADVAGELLREGIVPGDFVAASSR